MTPGRPSRLLSLLLLAFVCLPLRSEEGAPSEKRKGQGGQWDSKPPETLDEAKTMAQQRAAHLAQRKGLDGAEFEKLWAEVGELGEAEQLAFYKDYIEMSQSYQRAHFADKRGHDERADELRAKADKIAGRLKGYGDAGEMFAEIQMKAWGTGGGQGPGGGVGNKPVPGAGEWADRIGRDFPDNDRIQTGVGDIYRGAGRLEDAQRAYQQAAMVNPRNVQALSGLSQTQLDLGDISGAVQTGMNVLALDPQNKTAYSIVKMYKDRAAASTANVEGGVQQAGGGSAPPQYGFAGAPLEIRQTVGKQAPPGLKESLELADTAARLLAVRDSAGAKAAAEKALRLHPENIRALWALYQANAMRKDYPAALKAIETALTIDGDNTTLLNAKSNILSRLGRYEEAMGVADVVLSASPGDAAALFNKSFALSGLGRRTEALSYLRQAAARDSRFMNLYERAAALPPDADLVGLFTGDAPSAKPAAAPSGGGRFRWAAVAGGVLAGLLLIVLGVSQGGTLMTSVTRGLSKLGSASPTVQPMAVGTPAPGPAEGLAASGIRIEKKIGQGGMGVVYMGTDTSLERPVAIKKMREEIRSDMRERDRFIKEAKTVAALRHPNIVEIYSIVEDGSDVYLVFEYVTGKTVHDLTYERGALPAGWAISVIKAVASALDYAHKRGVVHRDLKPSNIMVEEDGMVKVMDFGVARMAKDSLSRMSMTNTVVGTPPYMAPEQEQGIVRRESDVYALAVCLYEMVTGTLPFQGIGAGMLMAKLNGTYVPASRVVQGLPPGFDAVMAQALAPDPEKRLKSAGDFAAALSTLPV